MKKILIILFTGLILFLYISCKKQKSSPLEGTWKYVTVQGTGTGWVTGSGIVNIPTGDNLALIVSYRYNDNRDMSSGDNISSILVYV